MPACEEILNLCSEDVLEETDDGGRTALHLAAMGGHGEVVDFLLSKGGMLTGYNTILGSLSQFSFYFLFKQDFKIRLNAAFFGIFYRIAVIFLICIREIGKSQFSIKTGDYVFPIWLLSQIIV